jgi:hypothetical protein
MTGPIQPFAAARQDFSIRVSTGVAANEADWSKLIHLPHRLRDLDATPHVRRSALRMLDP